MTEQTELQVHFPEVDQAIEEYLELSRRIGTKTTILKDEITHQSVKTSRTVCIATGCSLRVIRQSRFDNGLYLDLEQATIYLDEAEVFMKFLKENSPT